LVTGEKAVVTWTDANGLLKHRYNVDTSVSAFVVTISNGTGDDLPTQGDAVVIAFQDSVTFNVDFDDADTFVASTNVRGVLVFMDATETEKFVMDMDTKGVGLWLKDSGFAAPDTGTPITHILVGSGSTSSTVFAPKVLCLYDATSGSGQ
jgi:hypothetical protein